MAKKIVKKIPAEEKKDSGIQSTWLFAGVAVLVIIAIAAFFLLNPSPAVPPVDGDLTAHGHATGNPNAPVTIVEFSDFQCPFCAQAAVTVDNILARYPSSVKLVYRHFPLLGVHPYAVTAAKASECASDQNKFWEMYHSLFQNQSSWSGAASVAEARQDIRTLAGQIGVNLTPFDACMDGNASVVPIQIDLDAGTKFGVDSTPTFFINGKKMVGADEGAFVREIDSALATGSK